jgi:GNAT superfamily N-acetyltransferase
MFRNGELDMTEQRSFTLRSYVRADAPQVVDLVNAATFPVRAGRGAEIDSTGNVHLAGWYIPVTSERVVVTGARDEIAGFAYFVASPPYIVSTVGGAVHPSYWGQGVGTLLVEWAEGRAREVSQRAPAGVRTVLEVNVFEVEQAALCLFSERGFVKMREWLHLVVELDALPPPPELPGHLRLREMDLERDWEITGPAMDDAFADHWGAISLPEEKLPAEEEMAVGDMTEDESYSNSPGLCFIVLDGDKVAGGILCNGKLVERRDSGRVGSLFVRPRYRRQGIGRALMLAAFGEFWRRGVRRIITDTDANSFTQAPRLYTSLGMRPYRHEFLYEKEIRPGKEVRRLSWYDATS